MKLFIFIFFITIILPGCNDPAPEIKQFKLIGVYLNDELFLPDQQTQNSIPIDVVFKFEFSVHLDTTGIANHFVITSGTINIDPKLSFEDDYRSVVVEATLLPNVSNTMKIENTLQGEGKEQFEGISFSFLSVKETLLLEEATIDHRNFKSSILSELSLSPTIEIKFSHTLDPAIADHISLTNRNQNIEFILDIIDKKLVLTPVKKLNYYSKYKFKINPHISPTEHQFNGFENSFFTGLDSIDKFPMISDEALMTLVQEKSFNYFWEGAHPVSGLARERNSSGEIVTTGGSGFGIMSIIVGIERNFISRKEGIERLQKIVSFLENADRFHGVWPHWVNGNSGEVVPFSAKDDGADLVETSFLAAGLLTLRQYLNENDSEESLLRNKITQLWNEIEWDWFTKQGESVLYWHWSPQYNWEMNHQIRGYNEALITYILAASSPGHAINADVYHTGWARDGSIMNGNSYYEIKLPLGEAYGGPLFFSHYSFLGIDPRNLSDQYANYWEQNVNQALINRQYCITNPKSYIGYNSSSWGLTASDNPGGYSAHSPTNDKGVITPTAALSSIPYTPQYSTDAIRHFYYKLGDRLWGEYGFYDAFNFTENWTASSYLAIDQGPIVIMIENYRSGLIWKLLMADPEVQAGLKKLGFSYE